MAAQFEVREARDERTGVNYLRIGHPSADVYHPYFHIESWSADDAGFVFHAAGEVWYFDIMSRAAKSLSARSQGGIAAPHVSRDGHRLFFIRGQRVCVMPLIQEGAVEVLFEVDRLWKPCAVSPNGDDTGLGIMTEYSGMLKRIAYVDLTTKAQTTCYEGHNLLGHVQMNPARRDLIMYADQHDASNWQRIYTVKANAREHFPFYHQRVGEWVTHECFSRNGEWVTFTVAQPEKGLHIIRSDGTGARRVAASRYWHACPSTDAGVIAADLYNGEVRLVQRESGQYRSITSPWMPGDRMVPQGLLHPHPCLSRTGRWLLHVDGSTGRAALRLIELNKMG
jgi:hypothetical protein